VFYVSHSVDGPVDMKRVSWFCRVDGMSGRVWLVSSAVDDVLEQHI